MALALCIMDGVVDEYDAMRPAMSCSHVDNALSNLLMS